VRGAGVGCADGVFDGVGEPAGSEFAARFPDGAVVATSVGFGSLLSTHCSFNESMLAYQKRVFAELAGLMAAAGVTPALQCGEYCWWYFTNWQESHPEGGMAYYDAETEAAALTALGRPLHRFRRMTDDPGVNGGQDALFVRNRLRDYAEGVMGHVRGLYPQAQFEVLFPYDVNHPEPAGVHMLGGALNRFVNLPVEWEGPGTSGFDRFKLEALDFGAWSRDLDLMRKCLRFGRGPGVERGSTGLDDTGVPGGVSVGAGGGGSAGDGVWGGTLMGVRPPVPVRDGRAGPAGEAVWLAGRGELG
jgi:hypothetical protein